MVKTMDYRHISTHAIFSFSTFPLHLSTFSLEMLLLAVSLLRGTDRLGLALLRGVDITFLGDRRIALKAHFLLELSFSSPLRAGLQSSPLIDATPLAWGVLSSRVTSLFVYISTERATPLVFLVFFRDFKVFFFAPAASGPSSVDITQLLSGVKMPEKT